MGYIYQADVYCDTEGEAIRERIRLAGNAPEDEMDEYSYDSDDFPKLADVENEESDTPMHCAGSGEFLRNPLTSEGYVYVKQALDDTGAVIFSELSPVLNDWAHWYNFTYWDAEECEDDGRHSVPGWYSNETF